MNLHLLHPQYERKSIGNLKLFTDITKLKRNDNYDKQQKMMCTADTLKNQQHDHGNLNDFDFHFQNKLRQFKMMKAQQIADIAYDGDIPVRNIIKRIHSKLQNQLFQYIQSTIKQLNMQQQKSAERKTRSPKQLGSTIQHALTPKSIQTPAFDFESSQQNRINQFSIGSNDFTLGNQTENEIDSRDFRINKAGMVKGEIVSEFTVGVRNPTSKRIKDKIMNCRRKNQQQ